MNAWSNLFPSVPAWVAIIGLGFEGFRLALRRMDRWRNASLLAFATWTIRPWTLWAFFNLIYRWRWDQGFHNRRTFPFYANSWIEEETFGQALSRIAHAPGAPLWGGVALAILLAMLLLLAWALRRKSARIWPAVAGLYALAIGLHLSLASLPNGAWNGDGWSGSLLSSWNAPDATMLYAIPHIRSSQDYFKRFLHIQPSLSITVHGLSHPPGASVSLYWIGNWMGVKGKNIRDAEVRLRYALGLAAFGALNVFAIFLIGRSLFDARTGFLAATLWASAPSVSAYITFAQDSVYALFFNLALLLGWHVVHAERRSTSVLWGTLLGADFFVMVMMNYSWCLATTIFVLLALAIGRRRKWRMGEYAVRACWPLTLMTLLAAAFLISYHLDYLAMYRCSSEFVNQCYAGITGPYQWIMALIGGQIDLFLLLGSVTCSAFLVALACLRKSSFADSRVVYLAIVLGVFLLPILFGPKCLKLETSRCWIWVVSLPLVFAADRLLRMPTRLFVYGAPAVSVLTYAGLRLFLEFLA